jgi:CIC family chloride channel protein
VQLADVKGKTLHTIIFLGFSIGIGILSAIGALFFRTGIEFFQKVFWVSGTTFLDQVLESPWWMKLLAPTAGGLVVGPIITYLIPEAKGAGVPEVIHSVASYQSAIRHRVTFLKALVTSLLIGAGASVGREGPIVQIGASVGSSLAQLFRLPPDLRRVCLASGAAAGIAATFNAPVAGMFFAVEVILLDVDIAYISHIIISSIVASLLSRIFWGEFPTFHMGTFYVAHHWELSIYLLLGIMSGLCAICFVRMIYATDSLFRWLRMADWIKPGIGGLLLGFIALVIPHVLGVGYETINSALAGTLTLYLAAVVLFAKTLATAVCIGSGMSGGIFAPSLVLGAALGSLIALIGNHFFPQLGLSPAHYAVAGMGAVVAGTTLAPITAVLTIFELTYTYQIILPLMLACIASSLVVRMLFGYSAYEMKLLKQGINIVRGHDVGILRNLLAKDFMTKEFESLRDSTPLLSLVDKAVHSFFPHFVVLDKEEKLVGVLSLRDLRDSLTRLADLKDIIIAADLMTADVITLPASGNLETALHLFEAHHISIIPITEPSDPQKVIGILKKDDLLSAYKEKVLKDRILSTTLK